ncbi:hypothetical protein TNCV_1365671 [Trichonephila clavipes]|nr:hypothetical protein TNCV_1365671 [Trichonephila clavipes]
MFQSGGQSVAKPSVLSSKASLVLINRPIEAIKSWSTLPSKEFEPGTCGVKANDDVFGDMASVSSLPLTSLSENERISRSSQGGGDWSDSPEWTLALSRSLFQASLLPASVLLVPKARRSFSSPSIHQRFGLPLLRVPIG